MLSAPILVANLAAVMPAGTAVRPVESVPRAVQLADQQGPDSTALTPNLAGLGQRLAEDTRAAIDAGMADLILSTAASAPEPPAVPPPHGDLHWRLGPTLAPAAAGPAWRTTQAFGSSNGLALMWRHEIDGSATLSNAVRLQHTSGPIDMQVVVVGRLSFLQGGPMALSYRSSTTLALLPFFSVGADAHGPLGTLSAIRPGAGESMIEPHLKFTLPLLGATAGATTGWRLPTGPAATIDPQRRGEFHWRLTFRKPL